MRSEVGTERGKLVIWKKGRREFKGFVEKRRVRVARGSEGKHRLKKVTLLEGGGEGTMEKQTGGGKERGCKGEASDGALVSQGGRWGEARYPFLCRAGDSNSRQENNYSVTCR